jgi:hypothetical protein
MIPFHLRKWGLSPYFANLGFDESSPYDKYMIPFNSKVGV